MHNKLPNGIANSFLAKIDFNAFWKVTPHMKEHLKNSTIDSVGVPTDFIRQ